MVAYRSYQRWLKDGLPAAEAYIERAAIHSMAKCYSQAGHKPTTPSMLACPTSQLSVVTTCLLLGFGCPDDAHMGVHVPANTFKLQ